MSRPNRRLFALPILAASVLLVAACGPPSEPPARVADAPGADAPGADALGAAAPSGPVAPRFEVDPFWPKPLPNHWVLGSAIGVSVDSRDHVWIIHRRQSVNLETEATAGKNSPTGECCAIAPPVIEFDAEGNVVSTF